MKRPLRVLHVEDNDGDALLVAEYAKDLETFDLEIHHVPTISEAVDVLPKKPFDVVLLDLGLPDGEGVEAINQILYQSSQICLIVITGNSNIKKAKEVMAYGAQDYLLKNHLSTYVLERSITYALERQEIKQKDLLQKEKLILLETAVSQSANSIIITDVQGRIEFVNQKTVDITGYQENELLGVNPKIFKSGDQSQEFYEDLWGKISKGTEWHGNFKNKKKDGSFFWEKASISPITNEQGDITHYIAIKEDITEQKMIADRLNFTLDAANIGSWEWNIIDDYVEHNEIWFNLLGYRKNEIDSDHHTWQSLIHSEDFEKAIRNLEAYLEGRSDHYGVSYRMQHKSGHYVWIYDTGKIIERDKSGNPTRMLGLHLDITEVKTREIEAIFERSLLQQSQSVSKTGSWYYSAKDEKISYVSDEFKRIMGASGEQETDFNFEQVLSKVYDDDKPSVKEQIPSLKSGDSVFFEHRLKVGGKTKWIQIIGEPQADKLGRYVGTLGVLRDVTTQKKYEFSLQENLQKNLQAQRIARFGYWELNLESGERKWSDTLMRMFDITSEEVPQTLESYLKWVHKDDVDPFHKHFQIPLKKRSGSHIYRVHLHNGEEKWVEDHWQYYPKKKDQPERILGVIHDITARKSIEEELAKTNARLKAIFNSMDDLIFIYDLEGYFTNYIKTSSKEPTYVKKSDFMGKHVSEVLPAYFADKLISAFEKVRDTLETQSISYPLVKKGKELWYVSHIAPLIIHGEHVGYTNVARNITAQIEYRNRLMESQSKLWMQSEFLPHISFTTDANGKTTYINKVGKEFYGNQYKHFQQGNWKVIHPDDLANAKSKWGKAEKTQTNYENLERHKTARGDYRWLEVRATPVIDEKGAIGSWIGISTDVNQQIKLQQNNEKLIKDLNERIKETQCLFGLAQLGHLPGHDNDLVITKALDLIPAGFLKPDLTRVSITYNDKVYQKKQVRFKNRIESALVADGKKRGLLVVGIPSKDELGHPLNFLKEEYHLVKMLSGTLSLIIENNEHMDAVEASENRFKGLIEKAAFGVGILKDETWVELNRTFLNLLKIKNEDEVIGKHPWDISPKRQPDGKPSKQKVREVLRILYKEGEHRFYWQHQASDNTQIDCDIWLVKHTINQEELTLVFVNDITEEMKAQHSLRLSEARFRSILEHATVGISIIKDAQFLDLNETYAKSLGYEQEDLRGKSTEKIRPEIQSNGQLSSELIEEQLKILESNESVTFKMEHLNAQGSIAIFDVHLTQMEIWGKDTFVGFTVDITEKEYINRYMRASLNLYEAAEKSVEELKQTGIDEILRLTSSAISVIHRVDEKAKKLTYLDCDTPNKEKGVSFYHTIDYNKKKNTFWRDVIEARKVVRKSGLTETIGKGKIPLTRVIKVPVLRKNKVEAIVTVANKPHSYTDLDVEMLQNFSNLYYSLLEKKRVEDELIETSVIFRQSQKVGRIGAWRYNFFNDEHWWSDVMYELFGIAKRRKAPPIEEVNKMVHPDDLPTVVHAFEDAQKTGDLDIEYRVVRPDDKVYYMHAMAQMSFDDKGQPIRLIGLTQNITEIRTALSLVEEKSEQYEAIVESLPGVVYRFRYNDIKLLYVSDYYKKMFGEARIDDEFDDSSIGYIKSIIHPDDFDRVEEVIVDAAENKTSFALKCRMINAEDKSFWVSNTGKPIVSPDGELIIEGFIYDITDRVRAEERIMNAVMEASDNEKTKISKEIHDSLQQTLTIASLNLEFVKREKEKLTERTGEKYETGWSYLKKALDQTRSIAHSLMPKAIEDFGVISLLNDMFDDLNKSSDVEFEFITNLSGQRFKVNIETNVYKIVQEATNNILKHAKANHVTVQYIKVGEVIQLSIEDDGKGFDLKKVDAAGGGFGLASMKSRAGAMSADFFVDSFEGRGTSMMIEFPFTPELIYYE